MLIPVPGHVHLKVLNPADQQAPNAHEAEAHRIVQSEALVPDAAAQRHARALVTIALDAAFGLRPLHSVNPRYYSFAVRAHLRARLRQRKPEDSVRGAVSIQSWHMRPEGEIYGTALYGQRLHAFSARATREQLSSFRVF